MYSLAGNCRGKQGNFHDGKSTGKILQNLPQQRHDVISLREEVEHIRNYMIIQNMRYDNIIGSEIVIEPQVEESLIPKLTLQPLIEIPFIRRK